MWFQQIKIIPLSLIKKDLLVRHYGFSRYEFDSFRVGWRILDQWSCFLICYRLIKALNQVGHNQTKIKQ